MAFFNSAVTVLQTLVITLGAGLGIWGAINLLEGYGNDNPGAKSQDMKQSLLPQEVRNMSELKPRITENGIDYIFVGDYYIPDLKLPEEHRPIKLMVKEIGEKYGIDIQSTEGNSHLGDFSYPKEDEQKLIAILDRYLKD